MLVADDPSLVSVGKNVNTLSLDLSNKLANKKEERKVDSLA